MRIIAGNLGGRNFTATTKVTTHAMSEKVRGALFNILGDISGLTILDAFAGTGALAFEAISRKAKFAQLVEKDRSAVSGLHAAAKELGVEGVVKITQANCRSWSQNNTDKHFDVIFCDPPYHDLQLSTVSLLTQHMHNKSVMVLSHSGRGGQAPAVNGVVVVDNRSYGDAALSFYRLG